jgi:hypothetical protein
MSDRLEMIRHAGLDPASRTLETWIPAENMPD